MGGKDADAGEAKRRGQPSARSSSSSSSSSSVMTTILSAVVCAAVVGIGTSVVRRGRGDGSSKRDEEDKALKAEPKDVVRRLTYGGAASVSSEESESESLTRDGTVRKRNDDDLDADWKPEASVVTKISSPPARGDDSAMRVGDADAKEEAKVEEAMPEEQVESAVCAMGASMRPALKLEVENGSSRGASYIASLGVDEFTVGRGRGNTFVVESSEVSTMHAAVQWNGKEWTMRDLGSLNGTRLNDEIISKVTREAGAWRKICHGDVIRLGERETSPRVSVHFFRDSTLEARQALSLQTVVRSDGSKPAASEDRVLVECPLRGNPHVGLFCVFDGHGGHVAAERSRHLFPEVLAGKLNGNIPNADGVKEILESAFIESDETMAVEYEGCTASVVLVWKDPKTGRLTLQAANVGDSSVAIGRVSKNSASSSHGARYITPEHKVKHESERNRLNEAGADLPPEATRLYGLALSRAMGDKFLKDQNVGLIANPFVSEPINIEDDSEDDHVLTICSDGIWDVLTPEQVYNIMNEPGIDGCLHAASHTMVLTARRRRSADDISVVTVRLRTAVVS